MVNEDFKLMFQNKKGYIFKRKKQTFRSKMPCWKELKSKYWYAYSVCYMYEHLLCGN